MARMLQRRPFLLAGVVCVGIISLLMVGVGQSDPNQPTFVTYSAHQALKHKNLYIRNCAGCHGTRGQGLPHQGSVLNDSQWVRTHSDQQILDFLRQGRTADHPESTMNLPMPARGGNMNLDDQDLRHMIGYMRFLQTPEGKRELR